MHWRIHAMHRAQGFQRPALSRERIDLKVRWYPHLPEYRAFFPILCLTDNTHSHLYTVYCESLMLSVSRFSDCREVRHDRRVAPYTSATR
jgi:hypothetical protein